MESNNNVPMNDLRFLSDHTGELLRVRNYVRWLRLVCWVERLPAVAKAGGLHLFVMVLHWTMRPTVDVIARMSLWITSLAILISVVYLASHISRRIHHPPVHWVGNRSPSRSIE